MHWFGVSMLVKGFNLNFNPRSNERFHHAGEVENFLICNSAEKQHSSNPYQNYKKQCSKQIRMKNDFGKCAVAGELMI
jgi:hypothetical protein